jgi:serine phosphatase RsbU (regulator of sigma subunit)
MKKKTKAQAANVKTGGKKSTPGKAADQSKKIPVKSTAPVGGKTAPAGKKSAGKTSKVKFGLRIKISLAIIALVSTIILIMAFYIIKEESDILRKEIINFAEREIERLSSVAIDSITSKQELILLGAIKDIAKETSIRYVYVLDLKNIVIQSLDTESKDKELNDEITMEASRYQDTKTPLRKEYPDPKDTGGVIYEFSKPLMDQIYNKRIGTLRLGFSDKIIRDKIAEITKDITFIALIFLSISVVGSIVLSSIIIKPIRKLSEGAAVIGTGNLDYKIAIRSSDELGKLADEFNMMTEQLKQAKNMEIEKKIMEEQIELAKEIQEGLNPMAFYDKGGVQLKGYTRAAKGVGGDYYDYIDINENMVGALISDVSGKGIPASLVMVMIRTVFVTLVKGHNVQCAKIVTAINDSLSADFAIDKFATLFFMIYNKITGELSFSNAGHGPLFCYRLSMNACSVTKLDGVPIGITEDAEYKQSLVNLNKGDIVILYTDGVTEMRNEKKEEYGRKRLMKLIIENHDMNAKDLVEKIVLDVDAFRGTMNQHDDMTMLILKRTE